MGIELSSAPGPLDETGLIERRAELPAILHGLFQIDVEAFGYALRQLVDGARPVEQGPDGRAHRVQLVHSSLRRVNDDRMPVDAAPGQPLGPLRTSRRARI